MTMAMDVKGERRDLYSSCCNIVRDVAFALSIFLTWSRGSELKNITSNGEPVVLRESRFYFCLGWSVFSSLLAIVLTASTNSAISKCTHQ
jgi:hypothetical protein